METLGHEWPGYEPYDVTVVLRTGETLHWTEWWAVDNAQILEALNRNYRLQPIWFRAVQIVDTNDPLDLECGGCLAAPREPCRVGCLSTASY